VEGLIVPSSVGYSAAIGSHWPRGVTDTRSARSHCEQPNGLPLAQWCGCRRVPPRGGFCGRGRSRSVDLLVAPSEAAIMAAPDGAIAPGVDGADSPAACNGPCEPTNRARRARETRSTRGSPITLLGEEPNFPPIRQDFGSENRDQFNDRRFVRASPMWHSAGRPAPAFYLIIPLQGLRRSRDPYKSRK